MALPVPLSGGSLLRAFQSQSDDQKVSVNATLQVLDLRTVTPKDPQKIAQKRYRLMVGDGVYTSSIMIASQINELLENNTVRKGSIVRIDDFIANNVNSKKVLIALNLIPLEHFGLYEAPLVQPPNAELQDVSVLAARQGPPMAAGMGGGGYGAPPPAQQNSMYGGPPPPVTGYNANPYPQQPPHSAGGYGAPPPAAAPYGAPPSGGYGGPPPGTPNQAPAAAPYGGPPRGPAAAGYGGGGGGGGGHYGAPQGGPARPAPQYGGSGPIARDDAPPRIMPISALNPYTARWAIKGRCTAKGELRRWQNVKGEGKVFSFDLLDRDGSEIRATGFGQEADKFFDVVQVGQIYMVQKASLQQKKPQFNPTNHQYEIRLDRNSIVEAMPEDQDTQAIPSVQFNFRRISDIETTEAGSMIDIIGIVESCEAWQVITRKTGEETRKRSLSVRDDSGRSVELTLWGEAVNEPGDRLEQMVREGTRPVLAAKALRVGDFNGRTLSTISTSVLKLDPPGLPQAAHMRSWYDGVGRGQAAASLSERGAGGGGRGNSRTTIAAIKNEGLGTGGKPDWITVAATIDFIKSQDSLVYPACPRDFNNRPCSKKMMDLGGGTWSCERCSAQTSEPVWRYMASLSVCDHTGRQWLTAFGDSGDVVFGRSAADIHAMEASDPQEVTRLLAETSFTPMVFRLKVAEDTYNDETRIKASIAKVERITDWAKEAGVLLGYVQAIEAGQPVLQANAGEGAQARGGFGAGPSNPFGPPGGGAPTQLGNPRTPPGQPHMAGGGGGSGGGGGGYGGPPPAYNGMQQPAGNTPSPYSGNAGYGGYSNGGMQQPPPQQQAGPGGYGGGGGGGPYGGGGFEQPRQQQGGPYAGGPQQQAGPYGGGGGQGPAPGGGYGGGGGVPQYQQQHQAPAGGYNVPQYQQQGPGQGQFRAGPPVQPQQPPSNLW